jgi:hypothetical protein
MKQQITITVPTDWSAVNLKKYLELQADLKAYEGESEATMAALFYHLCGMTPQVLQKLDTETFVAIRNQLTSFINQTELPLVSKFTHNGIEYGFYPNLSKIEYGAYVDISKLNTTEITEEWAKVMAILYRPISKTKGRLYEVIPYTGEEPSDLFMELGMDIHFGAWFFFINLSLELLSDTPNSILKTLVETQPNFKSILEKNGVTIQP